MWEVDPNEGLSGTLDKHKTDLFIEVGSQSPQSAKIHKKKTTWIQEIPEHDLDNTREVTQKHWQSLNEDRLYIYTHGR